MQGSVGFCAEIHYGSAPKVTILSSLFDSPVGE